MPILIFSPVQIIMRHPIRSNGQIYGGDFAKFCGLLRIYELTLLEGMSCAIFGNLSTIFATKKSFEKSQVNPDILIYLEQLCKLLPEISKIYHSLKAFPIFYFCYRFTYVAPSVLSEMQSLEFRPR